MAIHGPFAETSYKPLFHGHNTFPMRFGWLNKAYQVVQQFSENKEKEEAKINIFNEDRAIAYFGVGQNMVPAIRFWATHFEILKESKKEGLTPTLLGQLIFDPKKGIDPFLENPNTLWLLHWVLISKPTLTTFYWVFNYFNHASFFERQDVVNGLIEFSKQLDWKLKPKKNELGTGPEIYNSLEKDVSCFLSMYRFPDLDAKEDFEAALQSPLAELGLLKKPSRTNRYSLNVGKKKTLSTSMIAYAIYDFWRKSGSNSTSISVSTLLNNPGSPGRVFCLDETSLVDYLERVEIVTKGKLEWSESSGTKSVMIRKVLDEKGAQELLSSALLEGD
jgi:hypothetical protein